MTNAQFRNIQELLGMSGRQFAAALGVHDSAVSRWRVDCPIPEYISLATESLLQKVEVTVPLNVLDTVHALAKSRGVTFGRLLAESLQKMARDHIAAQQAQQNPLSPDAGPPMNGAPASGSLPA